MTRIFDHTGGVVERSITVGALVERRGRNAHAAQVTANDAEEAAAVAAAGIEMVVCMSSSVADVRQGSSRIFVTAAIDYCGAVSDDDHLRAAYDALRDGADAVITGRRMETVQRLTDESIPVMGHLGFIPRQSTKYGGIRAIGKTAPEAIALWDNFRRLEDAGAFGVECEHIPALVMNEINQRTSLVTVSLGSGPSGDVMFVFASDICGESDRLPRHARAYADIAALRAQILAERKRALTDYRADVASKALPAAAETVRVDSEVVSGLVRYLDTQQ